MDTSASNDAQAARRACFRLSTVCTLLLPLTLAAQQPQNPSPMVEHTRAHSRVDTSRRPGTRFVLRSVLSRPVECFIPQRYWSAKKFDILIHFHGPSFIVEDAVGQSDEPTIGITVNLGSGSSVYDRPFSDTTKFLELLDSVFASVQQILPNPPLMGNIILSGWSAGYGAVRRIISTHYDRISAILLLDGIHAGYVPEGSILATGGRIDSTDVSAFLRFGLDAARQGSAKRFLLTHSEVFPGTFASTTECADYLLETLCIPRLAILQWGPMGMQQLSMAGSGRFLVAGFAGNTAPDHVDHLHSLHSFLTLLRSL